MVLYTPYDIEHCNVWMFYSTYCMHFYICIYCICFNMHVLICDTEINRSINQCRFMLKYGIG